MRLLSRNTRRADGAGTVGKRGSWRRNRCRHALGAREYRQERDAQKGGA